jgi:hypothetical protein
VKPLLVNPIGVFPPPRCFLPLNRHRAGNYLNFDLAFPSTSIPDNFFPSNETYYGYEDFGVWNATYESTSCSNWSGWNDPAALGSVTTLGDSVCCPADTVSRFLYSLYLPLTEICVVKRHLPFFFRTARRSGATHRLTGCCSSTETLHHIYPYRICCLTGDAILNFLINDFR